MFAPHTRRVAFASGQSSPWYGRQNIHWLWRETRDFIERGLYGFSRGDTVSLDWYLVTWLPDALRRMAHQSHSHPSDLTQDQWDALLETMALGFEESLRLRECAHSGVFGS